MSKKNRQFKIVFTLLFLISLSCNLPVINSGGDETPEPGAVKVVKQELSAKDVQAFTEDMASDPATRQLLEMIRSEGYTSFIEGGHIRYSNGSIIRAVRVSASGQFVVLAQVEAKDGVLTAVVLEVVDQHTVLLRNQNNAIALTIQEDGTIRHSVVDSAGIPIPENRVPRSSPNMLASISQQDGACTSGMAQDYEDCLRRKYSTVDNLYCASALAGLVGVCMIPPYADCLPFVGLYLVECGMSYRDCMDEMVDDPPTAEVSKPKELESYSTCLNDSLFSESLYQVQVVCKDDRLPKPNDLSLNLTSGEAKDFTCTDCSGRSTSGTIPPPGEVKSVKCEYGCLAVGDGNDRCLEEDETPPSSPGAGLEIPAGIYTGVTTIPELFGQDENAKYYAGADIVNRIRIVIAADGTVSGDLKWTREGIRYLYENGECSGSNILDYTGTLRGKLSGESGQITFEITGIFTHQPYGCVNNAPHVVETSDELTADVTISGDTLFGSIPNSFSFTAVRSDK